jgi:transcriptional regulator
MVYLPAHFGADNPETPVEVIRRAPLATLVTREGEDIVANHIPLLFRPGLGEHGTLIGHVARANDLWRTNQHGHDVLAVFQAADAYISPNWYPTKFIAHEAVPTWNYAVVHAYGQLVIHDDPKWIRGVVGRLTKAMESTMKVPWKMADAPAEFMESMIANIVGIEIEITRLVTKIKANQNRSAEDRASVAAILDSSERSADREVADWIRSPDGVRAPSHAPRE